MAFLTIEGTYREGQVELTETPADVREARVLVVFLPAEARAQAEAPKTGAEEARRAARARLLARMKKGYHLGGDRPYEQREDLYDRVKRCR